MPHTMIIQREMKQGKTFSHLEQWHDTLLSLFHLSEVIIYPVCSLLCGGIIESDYMPCCDVIVHAVCMQP